jgi:hypothetical protein
LLIRTCGGDSQFATLAFLLIYNLSVYLGFVGFTIAEPMVLLAFLLILRPLRNAVLDAVALAALLVVLFMAYALAFLFASALILLSYIIGICPGRKLVALIPGLCVTVLW